MEGCNCSIYLEDICNEHIPNNWERFAINIPYDSSFNDGNIYIIKGKNIPRTKI